MKQLQWKEQRIELEQIGKGVYGKVYRAYDPVMQRMVAVKLLTNAEIAKREVFVMKQYGNSDYLPALYDFFTDENKACIVMEYIEGTTFGKNFDSRGHKLDERLGVQITINILKGLHNLHRSGCTHNDIKPKNVMMAKGRPDTVKVIDFNLCQKVEDADSVQKDLQDTTRMCLFLLKGGRVDKATKKADISNKRLRSVLVRAFRSKEEERYSSAEQYIEALIPFGE